MKNEKIDYYIGHIDMVKEMLEKHLNGWLDSLPNEIKEEISYKKASDLMRIRTEISLLNIVRSGLVNEKMNNKFEEFEDEEENEKDDLPS